MDYGETNINKEKFEIEMGPILRFFLERDNDELTRLADDLSLEAKEFFGGSLAALLGTMPDEFADTIITTSKPALKQMLYSAMVTGYMTKTVEDKVKLENLWRGASPASDKAKTDVLFDSVVSKVKSDFSF